MQMTLDTDAARMHPVEPVNFHRLTITGSHKHLRPKAPAAPPRTQSVGMRNRVGASSRRQHRGT